MTDGIARPGPLRTEMAVDFLTYAIIEDFEAVLHHLRSGRELMDRLERLTAGLGGGSVLRAQGKALDQILATLEEEAGAACERIAPGSRLPAPAGRENHEGQWDPGSIETASLPPPPSGRDTRTGRPIPPTPADEE